MNKSIQALLTTTSAFIAASLFAGAADLPEDIADMKVQELRAGGDKQKRYFLIHRNETPPRDGWRTLFVLPGGSGDAQFMPFVARVAKQALPDGYLVVQLVAPVWTPEQARNVVWPTDKSGIAEVKFTTLDFFHAVRTELAKSHKLNPRYSFTLTWSSSGMNGYLFSLAPKSGITGTFVAMSVFKPALLPPLNAAKGHPYFIYHSPQDAIPIAQAEAARDALKAPGAIVEYQTYEGGHGWRGDVFGDIRKGVSWLEQQAGKPATK